MKYSLEIQEEEKKKLIEENSAIIGEDGFGKKTGYIKVYSTIGEQNEYFHATITYVSLHAGIGVATKVKMIHLLGAVVTRCKAMILF